MTKRERQRVRRHAAVIAAAALRQPLRPVEDAEEDRWSGLRRWRGDEAQGEAGVGFQRGRSECGLPERTSDLNDHTGCPLGS
jgi:hypothetical protein